MNLRDAACAKQAGARDQLRGWAMGLLTIVGTVALVLGLILLVAHLTTEWSYWSRIIAWRGARFDDFATKFPARPVANGPNPFVFAPAPPVPPPYLFTVEFVRDGKPQSLPIADFLRATQTRALLIVKDDRLLYEGYANGADRASTQTSFSVAKSVLSALIGVAIAEGRIGGLDDPITQYLPELARRPGLDRVRVRHLLAMASGLRYNGAGSGGGPFGDDARVYYDPDLRALALGVEAEVSPGTRWQYNNFHPLLLGLILERATGRTVSDYLSQTLWRPLGMEAPGSWSLDSHHDGFEKMESGLNGRAIDFMKFGRLFLRGGAWEGRQILPREWVDASTRHDPSIAGPATSPPGEEWARALDYGYLWWIDRKAPGRFWAMGNFGQILYVAPDRDAVLARFGTSYAGLNWIDVMRGLASRLP